MEIRDLIKYIPNLAYVIQNVCKTSINDFIELKDKELIDKQLLCWGKNSKLIKSINHINFYNHISIGIVIYDKLNDVIFINKSSKNSYKLWKNRQLLKKKMKIS